MKKTIIFTLFLLFLLFLTLLFGLVTSHNGLSWGDLANINGAKKVIIYELRAPRILAAMFGGALLALSGSVMQGVLKNPLASPFTLGVSGAAAFGATFAIIVLQSLHGSTTVIVLLAFVFSMLSMLAIVWLGSRAGLEPSALILAGIALGTLFHALTMLLQFFATDLDAAAALFWTFGDMGKATWTHVKVLSIQAVVLGTLIFFQHWKFDALSFGDDAAVSKGVKVKTFRLTMLVFATFCAATVVAFFGIIGFIGLAAPHLVRFSISSKNSIVLPFGMAVGAVLLGASDILSRVVAPPIIIPIGIITALLVVPILLFLLSKRVAS
ncbi:MAG: iron ABC transporter permease [Campylobacteraceae bacterium]|nr:iron ABC transporter permease [Campylobacteraceae bacterium]